MERNKAQDRWHPMTPADAEKKLVHRDSLIDEQIRAAQASGAFDNLPGAGKPLPKDPSGGLAGDSWMSYHVLKQAGFVPEWIQLRNQIAEERPVVKDALEAYRRRAGEDAPESELRTIEERYVALATAINQKIDRHNLACPPSQTLIRFVEDATTRWT